MQLLPYRENSQWQMQVTLTEVGYTLEFEWNAINQYWVMAIYDSSDNPIVTGLKIVNNYDITSEIVATGMPLGNILCQSIVDNWENLQRLDLGTQSALVYYEPNEIETLVASNAIR